MRILFVNPYYKPYMGGIERIIEQVGIRLLARAEVASVGVLTTRWAFPRTRMASLPDFEVVDGIEVYRLDFWPTALPPLFHASRAGFVSRNVPSVLRQFRPDVVHMTYGEWWGANLTVYLANTRVPHVLSTFFHDLRPNPRTLPLFAANRWLMRHVDAVHVLTDTEREQVSRAYGAPLGCTTVIPPGVDIPDVLAQGGPSSGVTLLAVGRLSAHKGQMRLLVVFERLLRQLPDQGLSLWLVGDEAEAAQEIREFIAVHDLGERVRVFGHVSDYELGLLYRRADIFVLPTRYESFGLVFIEAMAYGIPVVTYAVGPVPSVLSQGAVLVRPYDEEALARELYVLICDGKRRRELGAEARSLVEESYGWDAVTTQFIRLYELVRERAREKRRIT